MHTAAGVFPTTPEQIDARIQELKAIHMWVQQNAAMLELTIKALEAQKQGLQMFNNAWKPWFQLWFPAAP